MPIALTSRARISGIIVIPRDGGDATFEVDIGQAKSIANGTGIDQANAVYIDDFSIAASGSMDIDLAGSLTDVHGTALVFTCIKQILLIADASNVNSVVMGNGANPFVGPFGAAAHTLAAKPGGRIDLCDWSAAGWAVTAATADILKLANSGAGTAVTGTIVIVGER